MHLKTQSKFFFFFVYHFTLQYIALHYINRHVTYKFRWSQNKSRAVSLNCARGGERGRFRRHFLISSHLECKKIYFFQGKEKELLKKEERQCSSKILSRNYLASKFAKWDVCRNHKTSELFKPV